MKNKMITFQIAKNYLKYLDGISDNEITFLISFLNREEKLRLMQYEHSIWDNFSRKRLFLFICNLYDFSLIKK